MKKVLFFIAAISLIAACTNDNLEDLHPASSRPVCDTTAVSFATDIMPIMNASCGAGDANCHINDQTTSSCGLANWTDATAYLYSANRDIRFLKTINHDPTTPTIWMPKGVTTKIDDCSISKITAWINQGKLNN